MTHRHSNEVRRIVSDARPSKFAHIVIHTGRYAQMQHFYNTLLLAWSAYKSQAADFLRYDDEHHRIVLVNMPGFVDAPAGTNRTHHISFTYNTLGELLGTFDRLGAVGIHPVWCINHGITTSIYYQDPDGTLVETQYDNLEVDECDAFMSSDYFRINSLGVDFDPRLLKRRYENGDPIKELIRQGSAPLPDDVEPARPAGFGPGGFEYDYRGKLIAQIA
jgi:catechol 2,3-dioxygenase-like lactoylglutathione lyase family enzyme